MGKPNSKPSCQKMDGIRPSADGRFVVRFTTLNLLCSNDLHVLKRNCFIEMTNTGTLGFNKRQSLISQHQGTKPNRMIQRFTPFQRTIGCSWAERRFRSSATIGEGSNQDDSDNSKIRAHKIGDLGIFQINLDPPNGLPVAGEANG